MPPEASSSSINDILPEETMCLILGRVDFESKAAVLRVCKRWYTLLTYPPPGSGVWGTLPLNLMKFHVRLDNVLLEWLARRAAGVGGLSIYAHPDDGALRHAQNQQLMGALDPANGMLDRREGLPPYRLTTARHFADMTLARVLGMLSPWLPPSSVSVSLHGATFEHRSFAILTSKSQPWLTNALVDLQLMSNMVKVEDRFKQLCAFTNLTCLVCVCDPGSYARTPCLHTVPTAIGQLTRLRHLELELHALSGGLPAAATALQALRKLAVWAGANFQPQALGGLPRLEELMLCLGKWSPPDERHEDVDEEGLASALAPLTRLTRLHLKDCGLGAIPAEVMRMRHLVDLDVSRNDLWRCGAPPPDTRPPIEEGRPRDVNIASHAFRHWQLQDQLLQELENGPATAAAVLADEAAPPGNAAGAGPAGNTRGRGGPRASVQDAMVAAADRERLIASGQQQNVHAAQAATAGHGWWPVGLADVLQGLTHLNLSRNAVKALPSELSRLTAMRELNVRDNMLGERACVIPVLPKLLVFNASFNRYSVLPPGLLQMHALTRLHFITADPQRTLPPLDPLLQMPNLQQVTLVRERVSVGTPAPELADHMMQAGAFEAKFVAMRQAGAGAGAQLAPSQTPEAGEPGGAERSTFMRLGVVEAPTNDGIRGMGMGGAYPHEFLLPGYLPPGHPHYHPHMHMFDPGDGDDDEDEEEEEEEDMDEEDVGDDLHGWAEDVDWGGHAPVHNPEFWAPH